MCVKILTENDEVSFNVKKPLEEQVKNCKQILVDFRPNDPEIEAFLDEVERITKTGVPCNLNIKVIHNNNVLGAKFKKNMTNKEKAMKVNELARMMALSYDKTDRALEEISNLCGNHVKE